MSEQPSIDPALASLMERAFRARPEPLVVTTAASGLAEGRLVFANRAFQRLAGRSARDLLGRAYRDLCAPLDRPVEAGAGGLEATVTIDGAPRAARIRAVPLLDDAGTARLRVIAHDEPEPAAPAPAASETAAGRFLDGLAAAVLVHRDFRPLYANLAGARMFGFETTEEVLAQPTLLRFLSLDRLEMALERHERTLRENATGVPYIQRCLTAAGARFWAEIGESLVQWQGARAVALSLVDASEHVRARKSEALLREAIDNLSDSFILYDADDRVVLTNRRFHEIFPFVAPPDSIAGTPMIDLVRASVAAGVVTDPRLRADNAEAWAEQFIAARHRDKLSLSEDTWPDGHWDLVKEQRLDSGGFVSVRTDITERKRAEFALRDHEANLERALAERTKHLEAVLANIAQGVVVLDPDLRVVLTNQGLHDLVGYPAELGTPGTHVEELIRNRVDHGLFLPGEDGSNADVEAIVEQRLRAYRSLTRETSRHEFPNGRLVEIRREKLRDGTIVCTFTDVTDRVNAEQELQRQREALYQSEKLSALGMLLAGVAHELNNPLSIVLGQAAMMESVAADKAQRERAGRIRNAAERCAKIIKTFLAMARDEPASREPVRINDLVEQAIDLIGYQLRQNDIEVERDLAAALPAVIGDPDQLNQVVVNLLINAMQAMEEAPPPRRISVRSAHAAANAEVELEIRDTGPGVPEEFRSRIFDPFFTTKPAGIGTGVGLAVCHGMVTAHGGTITVDRAPGGGARFRVRLPCAAAASGKLTRTCAPDKTERRGRVLVVDDEPEICEVLGEFLEAAGLEVQAAASGGEALDRLAAGAYDAVVCDLRLPGMDGPALYAETARRWPDLASRFVFATGDLLSPSSRAFLAESGRPCLEKPFLPEQARRIVAQVVEQAGRDSPGAERDRSARGVPG